MMNYSINVSIDRFGYFMVDDEMYKILGHEKSDTYNIENVITGEAEELHIDDIVEMVEQAELVLLKK